MAIIQSIQQLLVEEENNKTIWYKINVIFILFIILFILCFNKIVNKINNL